MADVLLDHPLSYHPALSIVPAADTPPIEAWAALQIPAESVSTTESERAPGVLVAHLPQSLCDTLRGIGANDIDGLSSVLLTAFALLMSRYTGEERITFALPAGAPGTQPALVQALPMDLAGDLPVSAALQTLAGRLQRPSEAAGSGLWQLIQEAGHRVSFLYRHGAADHGRPHGPTGSRVSSDLRLEIGDGAHGAQAIWIYHPARFSHATIVRMHGHFRTLLGGIAANPAMPIMRLPLLTAPELDQILNEWNATDAPYPSEYCIHTLFEQQAAVQPDAPALLFEGAQISYRDLNVRANQLAHRLQRMGVGPDTIVGIEIERSPELLIGILGVLKAGGAYLPLDPSYPPDRLAFMMTDAQVRVLLTTRVSAGEHPIDLPERPATLLLDSDWSTIAEEPETDPICAAGPDHLAYVIYTSGSTGRPKGTLLAHRGLCNLLAAQQQMFALGPGARVLQFASSSFDASVWEWVMALGSGATLCLARQETLVSTSELATLLREQAITIATLPPTLLATLPAENLPALTTVITAGEACTPDLVARWARGRRFINAYGPTETTICASWYVCDPSDPRTPPIGRPLPNMQLYILDAYGRPVPVGVPGELHIGGFPLARGYLNRPELTAERFIDWSADPAVVAPQSRLYRTGDLVRYRADGCIEFLGRIDHQIKLRGFRIELSEIEATLLQHSAVRGAVVVAREDLPGLPYLAGYIVLDPTLDQRDAILRSRLRQELRAFLSARLPEYMLPPAMVLLDAFPLTPNGKVNRRALPTPGEDDTAIEPSAAPRTPEEVLLADIWAQVLGRSRIGVHDDFFTLGGHSLLAARAVMLVGRALGRDIPLRLIFEAPTIAAFVQALAHGGDGRIPVAVIDLVADATLDPAIIPSGDQPDPGAPPRAIFLTGATGFLGAFLLRELLAGTDAAVYCLVRGADTQAARRRIDQTLDAYQIDAGRWSDRIIPVPGDLREPRFGLSEAAFRKLAGSIDTIYHAGAQVHYLYPYTALKSANVHGTVEVLRLACLERVKPVHYISSIATAMAPGGQVLVPEVPPPGICASTKGYDQSKWVAETLIHQAGARGLPVAVYRPGRVGGHSQTGACNLDDFFVRLLTGCLQSGLAPDMPMVENLIPVDYAAQAVVHLACQPETTGRIFHLVNPQQIEWNWVIDEAGRQGYELRRMPYTEWLKALGAIAGTDSTHPLSSLLMGLACEPGEICWIDALARHTFETQNASIGLSGSTLRCPTIDGAFLDRMLADSARRGLFLPPAYLREPTPALAG